MKLALALPLIYPVGSIIPFIVTLEGPSTHVLDLISSSASALSVTLSKTTVIGPDALKDPNSVAAGKKKSNEIRTLVSKGICWSTPPDGLGDVKPDPNSKSAIYHGEIRVPTDLLVQFAFPGISISVRCLQSIPSLPATHVFRVQYTVDLEIHAPGFIPFVSVQSRDALISIPVRIASYPWSGPSPRSYTPAPGYLADGGGSIVA